MPFLLSFALNDRLCLQAQINATVRPHSMCPKSLKREFEFTCENSESAHTVSGFSFELARASLAKASFCGQMQLMLKRFLPDTFILTLLAVIGLATLLPARGQGLEIASRVSNAAIFTLFFFHGLRLAHSSVWDGLKHWRLQGAVLLFGFGAIPLLGLSLNTLLPSLLQPELWLGLLFLCALPSTVQAAISNSSMAGGNVAASVIAAALSNLSGVLLTPLIFAALAQVGGAEANLGAITKIASMLLLPFALGQIAQRWLAPWAARHKAWIGRMDKLTIVITVYVAFSAAVNEGLWSRLSAADLAILFVIVSALLAAAFMGAWALGGALGLSREDRITLFYSGAHKSLATGAPMARILFPAAQAGMIIIPLMLYHQMQLIVSAWIAAKLNRPT
jgi:solute carrier family 10 (sodium/bile acid cotransporter), member 7